MSYYGWKPYVPVSVRRSKALKKMEKLRKNGNDIKPIEIEGRKIARTFWGQAWCDHIESFNDYENRLPRGRTYVRNGSVCHLDITRGEVNAMVSGSALYKVKIIIKTLPGKKWKDIKKRCAGQIGSFLELLQGKLSSNVMSVVTDRKNGLFPLSGEISLQCSCPDWAVMCKHVAAVLYGVGARLDEQPELLFLLRGVDQEELISVDVDAASVVGTKGGRKRIEDEALADVFGIEMAEKATSKTSKPTSQRKKDTAGSKKASGAAAKQTVKGGRKTTQKQSAAASFTGKGVVRLREKFGMSQKEFAGLLGVSIASINNWEKRPGKLSLQIHTLAALNAVKNLTKKQARRRCY